MSTLDRAKAAVKRITSNTDGFAVNVVLTTPTSSTINITGITSKIHLGVDTDGNVASSRKVHLSFAESQITDMGLSIRNAKGDVDLRKYIFAIPDSNGVVKKYSLAVNIPDETIGLITVILEDYAS